MKKLLLTLPFILSSINAECTINPVTGQEVCDNEDSNKTAQVQQPPKKPDNMQFTPSANGGQTISFKDSSNDKKFDVSSNVKKDNSGTTKIEFKDNSKDKTTSINFAKDTNIVVDENGNITHKLGNMSIISSKYGDIEFDLLSSNGKPILFKAPAGVIVDMASNKVTQKLSIDGFNAKVDISDSGKVDVTISSKAGEKVNFTSNIDMVSDLREDGRLEQSFKLNSVNAKMVSTKRAETMFKFTPQNSTSTKGFVLKGADITVEKEKVTATKSSDNYTATIIATPDDMTLSIENNSSNSRENSRGSYSFRKNVSDSILSIVYANQSALRRVDRGYGSYSYSTRNSVSDSIARSNSYTLTPIGEINIEEKVYFDGGTEIELQSGTTDVNTTIDTNYGQKSFNLPNANGFKYDSSGNFFGSTKIGSHTATIQNNSLSENSLSIHNADTKMRYSYSPRRDLNDFKVGISSTNRDTSNQRINISYSPRKEISYLSSLRANDDVYISPSYNATLQESITTDGSREVTLISGEANITIGATSSASSPMQINQTYTLPPLIAEVDTTYIPQDLNVTLSLQKGWNLIGSPIDKDIDNIFNLGDVESLYTYSDKWVEEPLYIASGMGIWLKLNEASDINFTGKSYKTNLLALPSGWSLIGVSDSLDSNQSENIESFWKFNGTTLAKTTLENLKRGDGVWVKKRSSDLNLNIAKGWNLLGSPISKNIDDFMIFGKYEKILTFKDSLWIEPTSIDYRYGFWLYSDRVNSIAFYGDSFEANLSEYPSGWSLGAGIIKDTSISDVESLWSYRDSKWLSKNELKYINSSEGFWIKKR